VPRGHLVVHPAITATTDRFDARVEIRPLARKPVPNRRRVRLHLGTSEVLARLVLLGGRTQLAPKESAFAQLVCEEPVVAFRGDRFIVRSETADRTIGGGRVVHPFAPRHRARDKAIPEALERIDAAELAPAILSLLDMDREFARPPAWIAQALDVEESAVLAVAKEADVEPLPGGGRPPEALAIRRKWNEWLEALLGKLALHHKEHALLPGMEMELLRTQLPWPVPAKLFREIVDRLAASKKLVREDSLVRLPNHKVALGKDERTASDRIELILERGGFTPPDLKEIADEVKLEPRRVQELLQALERAGKTMRVTNELWYHAPAVERLRTLVGDRIRAEGELSAAVFRDMIQATRKFAIPLLEYFDRTGFTIRVGDVRKLRKG
jgi:selenocysteine-specific elongation factor